MNKIFEHSWFNSKGAAFNDKNIAELLDTQHNQFHQEFRDGSMMVWGALFT